jgi:glycosyltransferase involved in cell wall biosynthesis
MAMRMRFESYSVVNDIRWFAPNRFTALVLPELRRRGLTIAQEGSEPARLALAMSGSRAEEAWRYARARGCPLVVYLWDLPPRATGSGSYDPVWSVGGLLIRFPRPVGGFGRRRGYYSRLRYIASQAQEVWVPSRLTADLVRERFGVESRRVPYCYDSERFQPGPARREVPALLLTVSRFKPHKNQSATIRAAARLGSKVQVRLIGRGPEQDTLMALAKSLRVRCRIDSEASDSEVLDAYHRACVVVCPSLFEGFGVTPLEAIASGTPVVASDIPTHREFIGDAAQFFDVNDEDTLVSAISTAMNQPAPNSEVISSLTIPAAADRFWGGVISVVR